ncbi:MAG TPA: 2-C-methyl-D-erythritol 4-phosphate cytidylyltransferase [Tepidisphaeraceae bacterium]|jgi:hypothetical protein|nr:2-C-methyl-D-erythritol 4-phosphate cytidylyltransferase [Tepidisphaeraceae bacterium]
MGTNAHFSIVILTAPPITTLEGGGAFVKVDGRECLLRSVELFLNRENVKQIQVVFTQDAAEEAKRRHGAHLSFSGVKVAIGGPDWMDQLTAAAANITDEATHVLIHDSARPVVPFGDIDRLMAQAEKGIATLALPVPGRVLHDGKDLPGEIWVMQGMEIYDIQRFRKMVAEKLPVPAKEMELVKGSMLNVRCNSTGDASMVKAMLNMLPKPKKNALSNPFEEAQW